MRVFFVLFIVITISHGNASDQKLPLETIEEKSSHDRSPSRTSKSHISQESSDTEDSDGEDSNPPSFTKQRGKSFVLPKSQTDTFLSHNSEPLFPPHSILPLTMPGSSVDVVKRSTPSATHTSKSPRRHHQSLILHAPRDTANTIEPPQHSLTLEDVVKTDIYEEDPSSQNVDDLDLSTARKKSSFPSFLTPRSAAKKDSPEDHKSQHIKKQSSRLLKTFDFLYLRKKSVVQTASSDLESFELASHFPKSPASSSSIVQSVETSMSLEETAPFITFDSIITPEFIETYQALQKFCAKVSSKQKPSRSLTKNIEVTETQLRHITEKILERLSFAEKTLLAPWRPHGKSLYQRKKNETEAERVCRGMKGFCFQKSDELETVVEYRATSLIPENKKHTVFLADLFANFFEIHYKGACVADICTIPYTKFSDAFLLFLTFPRSEPRKKSSALKSPVTFGNKNSHIIQKLIFQEEVTKTDPDHPGLHISTLAMQTDTTDFRFYNDHSAVFLLKGLKYKFEWFEYIDWRRMLLSGIQQSIDLIQSEYLQEKKLRDVSFIGWKNQMNLPYIQELLHYAHPEKACAGQTSYFATPGIPEGLIDLLNDNLNTPREKPASSSSGLSPESL